MWRGYAFKKGTPLEAINYISDVLQKVSKDSEWLAYCKQVYSFSDYIGTKDFSKKIETETNETIKFLEEAGLLNTYVKEGKWPLWVVAIILAFFIGFVLLVFLKFDLNKLNYNIIISGIFIWIAAFFYYQTTLFDIPKGLNITSPALIPRIWVFALAVFCIWNIVNELKNKSPKIKSGRLTILGKMLLALLIYFIAIPYIGYFLSTPIFLITGMYILNYRKWSLMIVNAFGFVLFSYVVFDLLLKIELPLGSLFN
jgi:hypothetical protein